MEAFNLETNQEISELLHRQQVLESIKTGSGNKDILSNAYAKNIISQSHHKISFSELLRIVPAASFIAVNLFFTITVLFAFLITLIAPSDNNTTTITMMLKNTDPDTALGQAGIAMNNGDYDTARSILTKKMDEYPLGVFFFIDYCVLCQLEGNQDEAAMTMVNFLNNNYGTQNISSSKNLLYKCLIELTGPFSPDMEKAYTECLTACEKSIENFKSLDSFMENEEYSQALQLCDSMQSENTMAAQLYTYYHTCYMKLGEYEKCAAYFLSLAEEWQTEEFPLLRLPAKSIITKTLTELKPYVSLESQQEIDIACHLLEQD